MGAAVIPAVILGSSLLATGVGIAGQVQQANAAKAQSSYQAQIAKNNALLAQQKAEDARARGTEAARLSDIRTRLAIGANKADAAARGVLVGEGSSLQIGEDIAAAGQLNRMNILRNAELEAQGFRAQGAEFENEATLRTTAGRQAQTASAFRAGSTALTGASSVASKWYTFNQLGAFS